MRDYTRKAKRVDNGEWVIGYYVYVDYLDKHYILASCKESLGVNSFLAMKDYEIDPTTICYPTGLTDKNGNKVWENDILRGNNDDRDLEKVVFGEFGVIDVSSLEVVDKVIGLHYEVIPTDHLSRTKPFCLSMPLTSDYINRCNYEVIGNVFDNVDMLEE